MGDYSELMESFLKTSGQDQAHGHRCDKDLGFFCHVYLWSATPLQYEDVHKRRLQLGKGVSKIWKNSRRRLRMVPMKTTE